MPRHAVTLREVAQAAGVHPGTASRALNDATRSLVRPTTVDRVLAVADALAYKPNLLARSFKTRRTRSVGIVVPDIHDPLVSPMVRGAEDRLFEEGYVVLLASTDDDMDRQRRISEGMVERRVDGVVLATARSHDPSIAELEEQGLPVVLMDRVVEDRTLPSVSVDDAAGIGMVVEHLRGLGHERIGHVAGPQWISTGSARHDAFVSAMQATGGSSDDRCVAFAERFSIAEGARCARRLFTLAERPTAIVAANDVLALGCCSASERAGLRCPEDVSIVGFDDMALVDRTNPPLTTVRVPHYELGARAAELLLGLLRDPDTPGEVLHLPAQLVVRGSTAGARERLGAA